MSVGGHGGQLRAGLGAGRRGDGPARSGDDAVGHDRRRLSGRVRRPLPLPGDPERVRDALRDLAQRRHQQGIRRRTGRRGSHDRRNPRPCVAAQPEVPRADGLHQGAKGHPRRQARADRLLRRPRSQAGLHHEPRRHRLPRAPPHARTRSRRLAGALSADRKGGAGPLLAHRVRRRRCAAAVRLVHRSRRLPKRRSCRSRQ